ncbi:hypothetical protein LE181_23100 [Streptomyces sp. SCA3-4]|uniref:hypothetical protein n=1 Tax=Streptomyces sichuanensis TaxID=2871810 RepID=UPI001CE28DB5|nr:hypothetical protein [Streptomyces sichuanensis]MCA6095046.1 hypothetical protein [Streptomyces sichuanensis]
MGSLSSGILDSTGLHGEVTDGGPAPVTFDKPNGRFTVQRDWSIWKLSPDALTSGFERLHQELPKHGWKITHYGPANSKAQQLQIKARHEKDGSFLFAELLTRSTRQGADATSSKTDLISFTVTSPAYRAPDGVDPNGY